MTQATEQFSKYPWDRATPDTLIRLHSLPTDTPLTSALLVEILNKKGIPTHRKQTHHILIDYCKKLSSGVYVIPSEIKEKPKPKELPPPLTPTMTLDFESQDMIKIIMPKNEVNLELLRDLSKHLKEDLSYCKRRNIQDISYNTKVVEFIADIFDRLSFKSL